MNVSQNQLEAFAAAARRCGAYGLMQCSSGNLSQRLDDAHMLVKSSRSWMADLTAGDVALCRIADGLSLNGKTPSVEIGFHSGVLRIRKDVNIVLHFQTPFATTLCCRKPPTPDYFIIPEIAYYIGPIATVPYVTPGTPELATEVMNAMANHNMVQMTNHGQVTVGKTFDEAIQRAVFFELACELIVRNGERAQCLTEDAIRKLKNA